MKIGKRGRIGSKTEANGRSRSRARKAENEKEKKMRRTTVHTKKK